MNEADKAVIIMYPDCRTTGGTSGLNNGKIPLEGLLTADFFQTIDRLLNRYQNHGFRIYGVSYTDTEPENFSPIYPYLRFDELVPVNIDLKHWQRDKHKELLEDAIERLSLSPGAKTVIGGYHTFDCVALMVRVLLDKGFSTIPDLRLTEELGPLLIGHKIRQIVGSKHGQSDRKMERLIWQANYARFENVVSQIR